MLTFRAPRPRLTPIELRPRLPSGLTPPSLSPGELIVHAICAGAVTAVIAGVGGGGWSFLPGAAGTLLAARAVYDWRRL